MNKNVSIYWIRKDLRIHDNPALVASIENGAVLPIYILDDTNPGEHELGSASRIWLHQSLEKLNKKFDNSLKFFKGNPIDILANICESEKIYKIFWNRVYEPWSIQRDKKIKDGLKIKGIDINSFNGSLLWEPWEVLKNDGTPYRVFTPYYRRGCLSAKEPRVPKNTPNKIDYYELKKIISIDISNLNLLPEHNWKDKIIKKWKIGEDAAQEKLEEFVDNGLDGYKDGRNFPNRKNVSRLSPHLHWGEISPNTIWHRVWSLQQLNTNKFQDTDTFLSEMGWREFSYYLLFYFPDLPKKIYKRNLINFLGIIIHHFLKPGNLAKQVIQL